MIEETAQPQSEEEREIREHDAAKKDICAVLATLSGQNFLRYLLKHFEVGEMPEIGLTGELLHDRLGFLRSGNSLFKLIAEAAPDQAGALLARIERERYHELIRRNAQGS